MHSGSRVSWSLPPNAARTGGPARDTSLPYSVAEKPVAFTIFAQRSNC
jgi:hypothetical protein